MNGDSSKGAGGLCRAGGRSTIGARVRLPAAAWQCQAPTHARVVVAVKETPSRPEPEPPAEGQPAPPGATPMVIWVHDGPVCVTVVDPAPPHAPSGICRCAACRAHDPDAAARFF
jgi:hypothetical protein